MYKFYALLKDAFRDKVRMLYNDTDSFFLQFVVDDLKQALLSKRGVLDAFDFSEVFSGHPSRLHFDGHAGEVRYFKNECKGNQIVEFVALRPKIYSFTVINADEYDPRLPVELIQLKHKAVPKGLSRANIKQFTHDDYVRMFRESDARKVKNRRIGSKLQEV